MHSLGLTGRTEHSDCVLAEVSCCLLHDEAQQDPNRSGSSAVQLHPEADPTTVYSWCKFKAGPQTTSRR